MNIFLYGCVLEVLLFALVIALMEIKNPSVMTHPLPVRPSLLYDYDTRTVILDGRYIVASFRNQSLNHTLFEYLYNNPDRKIALSELDDVVLRGRILNLTKAADAMGFRNELRRLLFTADASSIIFHPSRLKINKDMIKVT
ncbi:hypothetical protein [Pantoea phytobeneficialis]|uniref:Uncharacterized protein n=1 Tax=Pantoea phytobeneficialis TaxID=2052056 RepID=A0AAP9H9F4_9GAMM|nr:hypothetical protein [Pantoea phytobeneficialis]MDO6409419.1 hypothetical protein [Pantoea phytobeneficialis]QGR08931.1 hypothetical protein CTZ24_20905 [Pantoea phytobeneficialis]